MELVLDQKLGDANLYAKLKIRIESTLEDIDITEMQKQSLEAHTPPDKTWVDAAEGAVLPHIVKDLSERGCPELAKTVSQNSQAFFSMLQEMDSLGEYLGPCDSFSAPIPGTSGPQVQAHMMNLQNRSSAANNNMRISPCQKAMLQSKPARLQHFAAAHLATTHSWPGGGILPPSAQDRIGLATVCARTQHLVAIRARLRYHATVHARTLCLATVRARPQYLAAVRARPWYLVTIRP